MAVVRRLHGDSMESDTFYRGFISPEAKQKKLFKVGGKHETCHKDIFRDGEVKLVRSSAKSVPKPFQGGPLAFVLND